MCCNVGHEQAPGQAESLPEQKHSCCSLFRSSWCDCYYGLFTISVCCLWLSPDMGLWCLFFKENKIQVLLNVHKPFGAKIVICASVYVIISEYFKTCCYNIITWFCKNNDYMGTFKAQNRKVFAQVVWLFPVSGALWQVFRSVFFFTKTYVCLKNVICF